MGGLADLETLLEVAIFSFKLYVVTMVFWALNSLNVHMQPEVDAFRHHFQGLSYSGD